MMAANIATSMINNAMATMQSSQSNASQEILHKIIQPSSFTGSFRPLFGKRMEISESGKGIVGNYSGVDTLWLFNIQKMDFLDK